jgi:hypothetical protein
MKTMSEFKDEKWKPISTDPVNLLRLENANKRRLVTIVEDIFAPKVTDARIDLIFAVICSLPWHQFVYETKHKKRRRSWMARVRRGGKPAVRQWLKETKELFLSNCDVKPGGSRWDAQGIWDARSQTGYFPTPAPTPQVQFIYNEAAKQASATGRHGRFVGPVCCWRAWPLNNVNAKVAK